MKGAFGFSFCLLFLILFFVSFAFIGEGTASSSSGLAMENHRAVTTMSVKNRKIKGNEFLSGNGDEEEEEDNSAIRGGSEGAVNLEDYRPIDPVPSSKASIRPGPIQHGTPLLPYIPNPSPPPDLSKIPTFFP